MSYRFIEFYTWIAQRYLMFTDVFEGYWISLLLFIVAINLNSFAIIYSIVIVNKYFYPVQNLLLVNRYCLIITTLTKHTYSHALVH